MNTGKIIGAIVAAAGVGAGIYYGFVRKNSKGLTWFASMTNKKVEEPPAKLLTPESNPVHNTTSTPKPKKEVPKADPAPSSQFTKGQDVIAATDMLLYTQPSAEPRFVKAMAAHFDPIGVYDSTSASYPGWSKIYVIKVLKNSSGIMVPNKWMAYVKTNSLTNPVK